MGQTTKQKMIAISKKAADTTRVPFGALLKSNPQLPSKPKHKKK
jgi:hypothetical protein